MWGGISASRSGVMSLAAPGSALLGAASFSPGSPRKHGLGKVGLSFLVPSAPMPAPSSTAGTRREDWAHHHGPLACALRVPTESRGAVHVLSRSRERILGNRQPERAHSSGLHSSAPHGALLRDTSQSRPGPEYTGDPSPLPKQRPHSRGTDV